MNRTRPNALAQAARRLSLLLCAGLMPAVVQAGPVSITDVSTVYSQNFDGLANSGANTWTNGTTLEGWYLFNGAAAVTTYLANAGVSTVGALMSYGSVGSTDRALGAMSVATAAQTFLPSIALALTNNTGAAITSFTLNYDGEQWRNAANGATSSMAVGYRKGASYSASGYTSTGADFNFISPVNNIGTAGPLDGNDSANRIANRGGTITTNWADGETLWLRFAFSGVINIARAGLAIDNLSLSFTPATTTPPSNDVPEPGTLALVAAGLAAAWARNRR